MRLPLCAFCEENEGVIKLVLIQTLTSATLDSVHTCLKCAAGTFTDVTGCNLIWPEKP